MFNLLFLNQTLKKKIINISVKIVLFITLFKQKIVRKGKSRFFFIKKF